MCKWIDIKEKIPEKYKDVLILFEKDGKYRFGIGFRDNCTRFFHAVDYASESSSLLKTVTHWMELPEVDLFIGL
jgi:Protein of unknown function (DUF551)